MSASSEWKAEHVPGCATQPLDDQVAGQQCTGCLIERRADMLALCLFQSRAIDWWIQPSWGRG